ncbi:MAG: pyridoxal 5'-phosphate synthase, partial [Sphingomonadaceae bacterium]|nr:pyridoxal 5'-phosphate synthase [Sphingomonadaceae bacterium]
RFGFLSDEGSELPVGFAIQGEFIGLTCGACHTAEIKVFGEQVRIEGGLERVDAATADAYFASRPRDSQLGAVASDQSAPLDRRATFLERFEAAETRFEDKDVIRPPHWTGFCLVPTAIEFWLNRRHRLHERHCFTRDGDMWKSTLLYP